MSGSGERDNLTIFVHGTWSDPSTFKSDFKKAVAQTLKDNNQKNFSWSGDNDVEARKKAGKELDQMIKKEIQDLKEGEKVTIIAHSHGGNVAKYASQGLNKGELDNVIFLATPHRSDASFNQASLNKGGRVVNVYDERDFVQGFFGKSDVKSLNPFSEKFKFKDLHLFAPNPKQTMPNAINIKVKPETIKTTNYLSPLEQNSYNAFKINSYLNSHSTIKDAEKWNQSVAPIFKGR